MAHVTIDPTLSINEIVHRYPVALGVLNEHGIDTCCGGAKPLEEVARRHALDLGRLRADLEDVIATCACAVGKGDIG